MPSLTELPLGEHAVILEVRGRGALRKRLLDMGVIPGAEIGVVRVAPLGDPVEYQVKGYRLSLRRSEAEQILVSGRDGETGERAASAIPADHRCRHLWLAGRRHGK